MPDANAAKKGGFAAWFSYFFGWITGLIFFFVTKDKFVKFHAAQSILFFGGIWILNMILSRFVGFGLYGYGTIGMIIGLAVFVLWIVLMVKAAKGEMFKLPLLGDWAQKMAK